MGATWLDQQLLIGVTDTGGGGFAGEVQEALRQRGEFLVEQGLAGGSGKSLVLTRNLLRKLREREIQTVAHDITRETGLAHWPLIDGQRVSGIYRRSVQLASGRFAVLENGREFSLALWKPVIERRLGSAVTGLIRGNSVSWELGRRGV
jgi:Protein of unknown function (DUF3363)